MLLALPVRQDTAIVLLSVLLLLTLAGLVVTTTLLVRRGRAVEQLQERLAPAEARPANAAEWALRTVVDTATRVRERGLITGLLMTPMEELTRWAAEKREQIIEIAGPDGTVTVLFSDIENSTGLNEQLGDDEWVRLLTDHDDVVRAQVSRRGGLVVKSQGDGFMVVFGDPADAIRTARSIQKRVGIRSRRLRRSSIRVRIGIHVGTVVQRDGDFYGRNVALAARVAASAEGGQVVVSDDLRARVEDAGFTFTTLGAVELKGLAGSHPLWLLE